LSPFTAEPGAEEEAAETPPALARLASREGVVEQAELAELMRERRLSLREEPACMSLPPSSPSSSSRTEEPSVSQSTRGLDELELPDTVLAIESFFLCTATHYNSL
jgi:hypothetical protein